MSECSIADCQAAARCKGMCEKHHKRVLAHGDPHITLLPRLDKSVPCAIDGCGRVVRKRQLCASHYTSWWRANNPDKAALTKRNAHVRRDRRLRGAPGSHSQQQWEELLERFSGKCAYCGKDAASRDHVVPLSAGGSDDISNILPACLHCNKSKKEFSLDSFLTRAGLEPDRSLWWHLEA